MTALAVEGTAAASSASTAAAVGAGSLVGVPLALNNIYTIYCEYVTLKTKNEELRSELRTLESGLKEQNTEVTTIKKKKELLDKIVQ